MTNEYKMVPVEPTEEIIRSMLAVRWPATYRNSLRFDGSGPATAKQTERDIGEAKAQYRAMFAAAPASPQAAQPVAWVECSPAWLRASGDCATAPRLCVGRDGISHLHPAHTHADAGEVGVMKDKLILSGSTEKLLRLDIDALRAQLAERDADFEAAMQKAFELGGCEDGSFHLEADELCDVIREALSTTAKPEADHE